MSLESIQFLNNIGIVPDAFSSLKRHPTLMIYSGAGCGKSVELAKAFQNAVFIKTAETVTRPYYSWLRDLEPELFAKGRHDYMTENAAHSAHPDFGSYALQSGLNLVSGATGFAALLDETTVPSTVSNWAYFTQLKNNLLAYKAAGVPLPFPGIIIDEGTEVVRRIYLEMQTSGQFMSKRNRNEVDDWKVMDELEAWLIDLCESFRSMGALLGFACQEAPPQQFEDPKSLHYGKQKYKGGPAVPFGRLRKSWAHALDICLRITLTGGGAVGLPALPGLPAPGAPASPASPAALPALPGKAAMTTPSAAPAIVAVPAIIPPSRWAKRMYWTEAHPDWESKFRDFSVSYTEELDLKRLLERSNYL